MAALSNDHIAIVDDDASIRRAVARLLAAHSFHVHAYASGREFLDALKTGTPACLILDLHLNNEISGLDILSYLAGARLRIPTIVATGQDDPGMRRQCELAGAAAFLVKPVGADLLLYTIRSVTTGEQLLAEPHCSQSMGLKLVNAM